MQKNFVSDDVRAFDVPSSARAYLDWIIELGTFKNASTKISKYISLTLMKLEVFLIQAYQGKSVVVAERVWLRFLLL